MDDWTAGDWTGLAGGVVVILGAIGKAVAWLLNWRGERITSSEARLAKWEASLDRREQEMREETEARLAKAERVSSVLASALIEVTGELRMHLPTSPAIARAAVALRNAFPLEEDFERLLAQLDAKGDGSGRGD